MKTTWPYVPTSPGPSLAEIVEHLRIDKDDPAVHGYPAWVEDCEEATARAKDWIKKRDAETGSDFTKRLLSHIVRMRRALQNARSAQ